MEELVECICDYVERPYTDYAIMINGEWGSGKTYFWNNKLRSRLESITSNGKKYKTIYMSLYGINSLEEISKKIFIETNPMISKTLKKFVDTRQGNLIPEYVKTGLDMANLFGTTNFNADKVDFSKIFAIDDKILCFDDLERANVDVIDILGYINNFVEHDGIKTILICNEKELATKFKNTNTELKTLIATYILDKEGTLTIKNKKPLFDTKEEQAQVPIANLIEDKLSEVFDNANAYERIKEKLIGETFEYIPEYAYILSGMIMKFSYNEELYDFYKRNTHIIISAFKKSETRNLRILKHALNDFEKIFNSSIKFNSNIDKSVLSNMLVFTIAMSFEIKSGNKVKDKLKILEDNNEYTSIIFTSKILNDNNQFYLKEFDNKYFLNNDSPYKFFKFIEIYVRTRYFDERMFKDNLNIALNDKSSKVVIKEKNYYKLLSGQYWKLSDFEFNTLWKLTIEEIKVGEVDFKDHIKLFAVLNYLIDSGLIQVTVSELKHIFVLGMQICASKNLEKIFDLDTNNEINKEEEIEDIDVNFDVSDKDIEEVLREYNIIKANAKKELVEKKANELFSKMLSDVQEFYKEIIGKYKDLPVFSRYDMDELYQKLELVPNYDLYNIINMFEERYKDKKELFREDYKSLKRLCEKINKHKVARDKTIKQALLENLARTIEKLSHEL